MIAPVSYIQPLTTLRRQRVLPVEGQVLVKLGETVHSSNPVARASLESRHLILDAARALGLPSERAKKLIQRSVGEQVEAGGIIAGRRGAGARQLRAPASGQIAAISESQILLQVSDESSLLQARVPGLVIDIDPGRGVTIECVCAWAQGLWGNGRLGDGILHLVGDKPEQTLTADQIDMSLRGAVLVAGICEHRQALELAAQVPIRGLVLGSLTTRLLPVALKQAYPIVLTEGFGNTPMNADAFKLLSNHNGDQATINAQLSNPLNGDRPEVIVPIRDSGKPPQAIPMQSFRVGQVVRVMAGSDRGLIGEITSLLPPSTFYPSGLHAPGASVRSQGRDEVEYPLANLELLG
ncbi:MAG: KOW motif-containing protein [Chloroflexi bacterium]|nr:KOW motif-containing protein [Chloroflexota bacterium]